MYHPASIAPDASAAGRIRHGDRQQLARALRDSRRDTLATFAACRAALPTLQVPLHPELNPPLWELGHVGWFQSHWTTHNAQVLRGWEADPAAVAPHPDDALYDSSRVPHDDRWSLDLPDADTLLSRLEHQLADTLRQLDAFTDEAPRTLYFHRLALLHEDMHHEAALYMARQLGIPTRDPRWQAPVLPEPPPALHLPVQNLQVRADMEEGFRFDNECGEAHWPVAGFEIDAQVVRWVEYLPFVDAGGPMPRYLRRRVSGWQTWRHGEWQTLNVHEPVCHISAHDARAWCEWAGRRLPTEAEWLCAHRACPQSFRWGDVWEWTASVFEPRDGFKAHPYRDYSAPWFDGRPVLKGASYLTQPRMRHGDYRNFFEASRTDIPAGFRSCR